MGRKADSYREGGNKMKENDEENGSITLSRCTMVYIALLIIIALGGPVLYVQIMPKSPDITEAIGALSSFYSMVFTIVAIFIGIAGLIAWKWIKEGQEDLEKKLKELSEMEKDFKDFKEDVKSLKKKSELAEWARLKFDKKDPPKSLTSISIDLSEDDKEKEKENLNSIEKDIPDETTDDSWLKLIYANQLLDKKEKSENNFIKIENILNYVETRDLLKEDSLVKKKLLHLKGLMYRFWYEYKKSQFRKQYMKDSDILWQTDWWKEDKVEGEWKYKNIELLGKSFVNYEKTLDLCENTIVPDKNVNETLGNLPVVLIELSKFYLSDSISPKLEITEFNWSKLGNEEKTINKKNCLNYAKKCLNENEEKDFNIHWDRARVLYYQDSEKNQHTIEELLTKTINEIEKVGDRTFFNERFESELNEKIGVKNDPGFPGKKDLVVKYISDLSSRPLSS